MGYSIGFFGGYAFAQRPIRIEAEHFLQKTEPDVWVGYDGTKYDADNANVKNDCQGFLANLYYDFPTNSAFTPYVGVGLGYGKVEMADQIDSGASTDDDGLLWQIGAGISYLLNERLSLELSYRYLVFENFEYTYSERGSNYSYFEKSEADYSSHNISVGIRYSF